VANSIYNSLQILGTAVTRGAQFGASYTLSKSMDNGSNQRDVVPNTYDVSSLWGPSEFDARNPLFQLPLRSAVLQRPLEVDWEALGRGRFRALRSFRQASPAALPKLRTTRGWLRLEFRVRHQRPVLRRQRYSENHRDLRRQRHWFDTSVFTKPLSERSTHSAFATSSISPDTRTGTSGCSKRSHYGRNRVAVPR